MRWVMLAGLAACDAAAGSGEVRGAAVMGSSEVVCADAAWHPVDAPAGAIVQAWACSASDAGEVCAAAQVLGGTDWRAQCTQRDVDAGAWLVVRWLTVH